MPQLLPVKFVLRFYGRLVVFAVLFTLGCVAIQPIAFFPEFPTRFLGLRGPVTLPVDVQELLLPYGAGEVMQVWKLVPPVPSGKSAIFFRGNGGPLALHLPAPRWLRDHGYTTYMLNYPSYGKSTGLPGEKILMEQAEALYQFVVRDTAFPEVIGGYSIGSAMATPLAARHFPRCLFLLSPLSTAKDAVADQRYLGWFYRIISGMLLYRFDNVSEVKKLHSTRLLIASGRQDPILPSTEAQRLLDSYTGEWKRGVFHERANHIDIFSLTQDQLKPLFAECVGSAR